MRYTITEKSDKKLARDYLAGRAKLSKRVETVVGQCKGRSAIVDKSGRIRGIEFPWRPHHNGVRWMPTKGHEGFYMPTQHSALKGYMKIIVGAGEVDIEPLEKSLGLVGYEWKIIRNDSEIYVEIEDSPENSRLKPFEAKESLRPPA